MSLHCSKDYIPEKPRLLFHFVITQNLQTSALLITLFQLANSKQDWAICTGSSVYVCVSLKNKRNEKWSQCSISWLWAHIFTQNLDTINPLGIGISILVMKAFGCYRQEGLERKSSILKIFSKTKPKNFATFFFFFLGQVVKNAALCPSH